MIGGFVYIHVKKEGLTLSLKEVISKVEEKEVSEFSNYNYPVIYDISDEDNKILCALNTNNNIKCMKETVKHSGLYPYISEITTEDYNTYSDSFSFNIGSCYFISFLSEYLLCCADENIITCKRINITPFEQV